MGLSSIGMRWWLAAALAVAVVAWLAHRTGPVKSPRDAWRDATAAVTWANPLCDDWDAFRGLQMARAVVRTTDEIMQASRFVGEDETGLYEYETPTGPVWMPQPDDLWSLAVVLAEQELAMYGNPGGSGVQAGDVVIDAGAHVGLFARTALAAGASQVVTFEVTPRSNRALRRNFAKEIAEGKVIVVEKGVWREEASLPLVIVEKCSVCNSVSHPWLTASITVPLTTIDHAVTELGLPRVDFIKLDIENAEANALRGAVRTIAQHRPRMAVALENSKTRIEYGHEVLGVVQEAHAGYHYSCGAITIDDKRRRILPEVLHFAVP